MIALEVSSGVPWWGVAVIAAGASLATGLAAAFANWLIKRLEIEASDLRQWDLLKYEIVATLIAQCETMAVNDWEDDKRGQVARFEAADGDHNRLKLIDKDLGKLAYNLLNSSRRRSQAASDYDRANIDKERTKNVDALIAETQKQLGRL